MNIYLLTIEQAEQLMALNTSDTCFIPSDVGLGLCVGEHDFSLPEFAAHKALLDSWGLPLTEIEMQDGEF
jgi:hypothetical protein